MADIKQSITTDSEQTKREYRALVTEIQKLREENRTMHAESKAHHESFMGQAQERVGEWATELGAMLSVEKVIEKLSEAYKEYTAEIREAGKAKKDFDTAQTGKLVDIGLIGQRSEFNAMLDNSGLVRAQAQAVLTGVLQGSSKSGGKLDAGEADAAFRAAKLYVGDDQAQHDVGLMQGRLRTFDPAMSAEQRSDLAVALRQATPFAPSEMLNPAAMRGARELSQTGAFTKMQSLGFEAAAVNQDLSPRVAATLAAALDKHMDLIKPQSHQRGKAETPLTADQLAENAYASEHNSSKRLDMLYGNRTLAQKVGGGQVDEALQLVPREAWQKAAIELANKTSGHLVRETLISSGMEVQNQETGNAATSELSLREHEREGRELSNVDTHVDQAINQSGAGWLKRAAFRSMETVNTGFEAIKGGTPADQARRAAHDAASMTGLSSYVEPHLGQSKIDAHTLDRQNERDDKQAVRLGGDDWQSTLDQQNARDAKAAAAIHGAATSLERATQHITGSRTQSLSAGARVANGKQ